MFGQLKCRRVNVGVVTRPYVRVTTHLRVTNRWGPPRRHQFRQWGWHHYRHCSYTGRGVRHTVWTVLNGATIIEAQGGRRRNGTYRRTCVTRLLSYRVASSTASGTGRPVVRPRPAASVFGRPWRTGPSRRSGRDARCPLFDLNVGHTLVLRRARGCGRNGNHPLTV